MFKFYKCVHYYKVVFIWYAYVLGDESSYSCFLRANRCSFISALADAKLLFSRIELEVVKLGFGTRLCSLPGFVITHMALSHTHRFNNVVFRMKQIQIGKIITYTYIFSILRFSTHANISMSYKVYEYYYKWRL